MTKPVTSTDHLSPRGASWAVVVLVVAVALMWAGCANASRVADPAGPTETPVNDAGASAATARPLPQANPELLSEWGQLEVADGRLSPADGVTPYGLNSALFSDYAHKLRTIWAPGPAVYDAEGPLDFPVGTVITKTFFYPRADDGVSVVRVDDPGELGGLEMAEVRLLETRVLVRRAEGWAALPYVWNDDQTDATLARTGDLQMLTLVGGDGGSDRGADGGSDGDSDGGADGGSDGGADGGSDGGADGGSVEFPYVVPNVNQCAGCHATNHTTKALVPIGPKVRHLNLDVDLGSGPEPQLAGWVNRGLLAGGPGPSEAPRATDWADGTASLDDRARAYLDINCAHCHNQVGPADTSALFLEASTDLGTSLGVCKAPIAAGTGTGGRRVGISPGAPNDSIFVYRMATDDPGAMMPELGRAVVHAEGVDLISAWITSLPGSC